MPDPSNPIGHALIRVAGAAGRAPAFHLRRPGWEAGSLGPDGWQVADASLQPDKTWNERGDLLLRLGPQLCSHVESGTYLFELPSAGISDAVWWPDIVPEVSHFTPPKKPEAAAPVAAEAADDAVPAATEADATLLHAPARPPTPPTAPPIVSPPVPPIVPPPGAPVARPGPAQAAANAKAAGNRRLVVGFALLVLLAVAGAAGAYYWFVLRNPPPRPLAVPDSFLQSPFTPLPTPPANPPPNPAQSPPAQNLPPLSPPAPPPDQSDKPPPLSPGSSQRTPDPPRRQLGDMGVGEVISAAPNPAAITAEGERRLTGNRRDDGLLLLEAAAERGDGRAMLLLARLYDPNGFQPGGPIPAPDARQAARYYRDASRAGQADAAAPRDALRIVLDRRAGGGDLSARLVLRDFWP